MAILTSLEVILHHSLESNQVSKKLFSVAFQDQADRGQGSSLVQQPPGPTSKAAQLGVSCRLAAAGHEHGRHGSGGGNGPVPLVCRVCPRAVSRGSGCRLSPPRLDQPAPPAGGLTRPQLLRVVDGDVLGRRRAAGQRPVKLRGRRDRQHEQQLFESGRLQEPVGVRRQRRQGDRSVRQLRAGLVHVDEERQHGRHGRMGRRSRNGIATAGVQQVTSQTIFL